MSDSVIGFEGQSVIVTGGSDWDRRVVRPSVRRAGRTGRLDVLVHSAGGFPRYISLIDMPVEDWDGVVNNNLKSIFHLLKAAAPLMIEGGYGRIVTL